MWLTFGAAVVACVVEVGGGIESSLSSASRDSISARVCCSRLRSRSSSSATRAWIWSSRVLAREESVWFFYLVNGD